MKEWFVETGVETNQLVINEKVLPYTLVKFNHSRTQNLLYIFLFIEALAVLALWGGL